jgi:hypothetical protein
MPVIHGSGETPAPPGDESVVIVGDLNRPWPLGLEAGAASGAACAVVSGQEGFVPPSLSTRDMLAALRRIGFRDAVYETADSLEELAQAVEGHAEVIAFVDAGILWDWAAAAGFGTANHAVLVRAVVREAGSGQVVGAYFQDPRRPGAMLLADQTALLQGWLGANGGLIAFSGKSAG